jgi:hypothetical protein
MAKKHELNPVCLPAGWQSSFGQTVLNPPPTPKDWADLGKLLY